MEEGKALRAIVALLNKEQVPTRGQDIKSKDGVRKGWIVPVVTRILAAPTYKGTWEYARHRKGDNFVRRKADEADYIDVPVPAIVDEATWERARRRAEFNKHHSENQERKSMFYLLRGLLSCDECGRPFRCLGTPAGRTKKDRNGKRYIVRRDYRSYGCKGQSEHPYIYECRKPQFIEATRLEDEAWGLLRRHLENPALLRNAFEDNLAAQAEEAGLAASLIAKRRRQIQSLEDKRRGILELAGHQLLQDVLDVEDVRKTLKGINKDLEMLRGELASLEKAAASRTQTEEVLGEWERICQDIGPDLDMATPADRRDIFVGLADSVGLRVWIDSDGKPDIRLAFPHPAFQVTAATSPAGRAG